MRVGRLVVAGLVAGLVWVAGADAAYVRVQAYQATSGSGPYTVRDVVYDGEGTEANSVVVTGTPGAVAFVDPAKPLRTDPLPPPSFDGNGNLRAQWACATTRNSAAICAATPGSVCESLNCSAPRTTAFNGSLVIHGYNGNDRLFVLTNNFKGRQYGGPGNDVIAVDNRSRDQVDCGTGSDRVIADPLDLVGANCEAVTRA